jgi:hypothetical protein
MYTCIGLLNISECYSFVYTELKTNLIRVERKLL